MPRKCDHNLTPKEVRRLVFGTDETSQPRLLCGPVELDCYAFLMFADDGRPIGWAPDVCPEEQVESELAIYREQQIQVEPIPIRLTMPEITTDTPFTRVYALADVAFKQASFVLVDHASKIDCFSPGVIA